MQDDDARAVLVGSVFPEEADEKLEDDLDLAARRVRRMCGLERWREVGGEATRKNESTKTSKKSVGNLLHGFS